MFKTVEGIVNAQGKIELLENITIPEGKKVLITILNPLSEETEPALFSEQSLAQYP